MYPNVHCSTIGNSQDMESTQMFINIRMDKEIVVCVYSGLLLNHKKEQIWVNCSKVDGPRTCYTEWSNSERKN